MKVSPNSILPSQDFLKPNTVRFIMECIASDNNAALPPTPIVRHGRAGSLVAIDGHNLIAVMQFLGQDVDVHLAESASDGLIGDSEAIQLRNKDLAEKYESVLTERSELHQKGIDSFADLIALYSDLFATC